MQNSARLLSSTILVAVPHSSALCHLSNCRYLLLFAYICSCEARISLLSLYIFLCGPVLIQYSSSYIRVVQQGEAQLLRSQQVFPNNFPLCRLDLPVLGSVLFTRCQQWPIQIVSPPRSFSSMFGKWLNPETGRIGNALRILKKISPRAANNVANVELVINPNCPFQLDSANRCFTRPCPLTFQHLPYQGQLSTYNPIFS